MFFARHLQGELCSATASASREKPSDSIVSWLKPLHPIILNIEFGAWGDGPKDGKALAA